MTVVNLSLSEIHDLALEAFAQNGCDPQNAGALTRTVVAAERDGSHSHGLFRVPGYVASLRSGKVKGAADPQISKKSPVIVNVNGDDGYAPLAIERGIPEASYKLAEKEILISCKDFVKKHPDIGAIMLECTGFQSFAKSIQRELDLPVYSWSTLLDYAYSVVVHRDFYGHV